MLLFRYPRLFLGLLANAIVLRLCGARLGDNFFVDCDVFSVENEPFGRVELLERVEETFLVVIYGVLGVCIDGARLGAKIVVVIVVRRRR